MRRKVRMPPLTASWMPSRAARGGVRRRRGSLPLAIPAERAGGQPIPDERQDQADQEPDKRSDEHGIAWAARSRLRSRRALEDDRLLDVLRLCDLLLCADLVVHELRP